MAGKLEYAPSSLGFEPSTASHLQLASKLRDTSNNNKELYPMLHEIYMIIQYSMHPLDNSYTNESKALLSIKKRAGGRKDAPSPLIFPVGVDHLKLR